MNQNVHIDDHQSPATVHECEFRNRQGDRIERIERVRFNNLQGDIVTRNQTVSRFSIVVPDNNPDNNNPLTGIVLYQPKSFPTLLGFPIVGRIVRNEGNLNNPDFVWDENNDDENLCFIKTITCSKFDEDEQQRRTQPNNAAFEDPSNEVRIKDRILDIFGGDEQLARRIVLDQNHIVYFDAILCNRGQQRPTNTTQQTDYLFSNLRARYHDMWKAYYIAYPLRGNMDISDFVANARRNRRPLDENRVKRMFRQMVQSIHYLHNTLHVYHGDLSVENFVVNENDDVYLIDFGQAEIVQIDAETFDLNGRICYGKKMYMPPEMSVQCAHLPYYTIGRPANWRKIDLWALATTFFHMLYGDLPPWCNRNGVPAPHMAYHERYFQWICRHEQLQLALNHLCLDDFGLIYWNVDRSPEALDLLQGMLRENPVDRLTSTQILEHPWLQDEEK